MVSATTPVQPVWCEAPRPVPLCPVEVLVETEVVLPRTVVLEKMARPEARATAIRTGHEERDQPVLKIHSYLVERHPARLSVGARWRIWFPASPG